ncbi:Cilia- and flagella-associated protein 46 [Dissostichus eleginoides]|uniref:Cilia- and flagella-associated protein 46 n=1 Tax=Dissostichus eleginoides TaxID=100907 RepID=A0AAD9CNU1_DISEL|nr:Cilia- and flagella-associated protein 46 [Dissostichus eleginoides]
MELDIRQYLNTAKEQQDSGALQSAYRLINDMTAAGARGPAPGCASELYVVCAEAAVQLGCLEISTACLKMYFEGNPPANQFLCRAYLCQVRLKSPPPPGSLEDLEEAVLYFLKAIEIAKHEPRDYFIVFNASVLYFQTVCLFLQPGWCSHLVPSLRQVVRSLEEVAEQDHSWRAELMMHLIGCIVDSGIIEDAASFAKETEEFIKAHTPHLYPRIFKLLVQHRLTNADDLIETSTQSTTLVVIYKIQEFKNRLEEINVDEPTKEELELILHILMDCTKYSPSPLISSQGQTPVQPADRVGFLLELALLALQVKHQEVAADCLKELKSAGEASIGQLILIECVNCEINLLKREAKMNDYSKASVEARLREIGKLDQCLQTAVRGGDLQAMQAVCVTQWSCCLPLLQHNLKKRIQSPLLRVSHVLEDMQSMLLEMRCQVHSELAVIEEEDGRLEASLTHLQKAMLLDNGTQQERLSSAVRLLQLRGTLYQTTSRAEDKAAMLMQQARDMQPQDRTDVRPILVAVGLLLSPDDFQIVLDADNTSKIPSGCVGSGAVAQLCAKAQHHSTSVRKVDRYLARQGDDTDNTERVKLWATLVKTARKQEVWDVCRAACRFCLLYDDGRWKISKTDKCRCSEEESCAECLHGCNRSQTCVRDLLRLLADIHFISAEASVQKLLAEGGQLNSPVVPAVDSETSLSEEDPHWVVYSFLRAAELGAEIREPWVVANAAVYLWNYSSHLLAAGEYHRLLPTFHSLVAMLQKTEFTRNGALFVLLCDAVARGLIQPLSGLTASSQPRRQTGAKTDLRKGWRRLPAARGSS